jgi:hypothetical protein
MLAIERAGDSICGLWDSNVTSIGDMMEAAGEYTEFGAGEARSEIVRHSTTEGVAATCKR